MRYLITVSAGARRISPQSFAIESAFAQHLRELKQELGSKCAEMVLAVPSMGDAEWEVSRNGLTKIDEQSEGIRFVPIFQGEDSRFLFLLKTPAMIRRIRQLVRKSDFIHSYFSHDIFRPAGAWFCLLAVLAKKPVIAIEDIDHRRDAEMLYRTGRWSKRNYLMCKYIYDPVRHGMLMAHVRFIDMMLFKELQQVKDYGKGRPSVRLFLDPNFSAEDVADDAFVERRIEELSDEKRPLNMMYFGRLVKYKGVDKMLSAVAAARDRGAHLTFTIMGAGEERDALGRQVSSLGLTDIVSFIPPCEYGPKFFAELRKFDLLLACPLSGDTPRSTWDAFASAMPILAFDTPFYSSIAEFSKAAVVSHWPDVDAFSDQILSLAKDKRRIIPMVRNAVEIARNNTAEIWLKRRVDWVHELL